MIADITIITVQRYRSPDGKPTCCRDHPAGETCRFMAVRRWGLQDVCTLGIQRDVHRETELGYTRPHAQCEVWANVRAKRADTAPQAEPDR